MFSPRKNIVYVKGQRLGGNPSKPFKFFKKNPKIIQTNPGQALSEIIDVIVDNNPETVVFYGHGNTGGKVLISKGLGTDISYHPANLEEDIAKRKKEKGKTEESKLKLVDVYGCCIGAGIGEDWLQTIQIAGKDISVPHHNPATNNMIRYTNIGSDVTYIINAGKRPIIHDKINEATKHSFATDDIFELILKRIITYPHTFKVLKRSINDNRVHAYSFSGPKPKSPHDLSDSNIKKFLQENIENFLSFYLQHYAPDEKTSKRIISLYKDYQTKIEKLDINSIRYNYLNVELFRGKEKYARYYLESYKGNFSQSQFDSLITNSSFFDGEESLKLLLSSNKVLLSQLREYHITNSAHFCRPHSLHYFLKCFDFVPDINPLLSNIDHLLENHGATAVSKTLTALLCYGNKLPKDFSFPPKLTTIMVMANYVGSQYLARNERNKLLETLFTIIDNDSLQHTIFGRWEGNDDGLKKAYQNLLEFNLSPPQPIAADSPPPPIVAKPSTSPSDSDKDRDDSDFDIPDEIDPDYIENPVIDTITEDAEDSKDSSDEELELDDFVLEDDSEEDYVDFDSTLILPNQNNIPVTNQVRINQETDDSFIIGERAVLIKDSSNAYFLYSLNKTNSMFEVRRYMPENDTISDIISNTVTTDQLMNALNNLKCYIAVDLKTYNVFSLKPLEQKTLPSQPSGASLVEAASRGKK